MAIGSVLTFWGVAILLIIVPGADRAFTIGAALRRRPVAAAVGGLVISYTAMTAVAAGIGAQLADTSSVLTTLTVVGGGRLPHLARRQDAGQTQRRGHLDSAGRSDAPLAGQRCSGVSASAASIPRAYCFLSPCCRNLPTAVGVVPDGAACSPRPALHHDLRHLLRRHRSVGPHDLRRATQGAGGIVL